MCEWWMDAWIMGTGEDLPATEAGSRGKWGGKKKRSRRMSYKSRQTAMIELLWTVSEDDAGAASSYTDPAESTPCWVRKPILRPVCVQSLKNLAEEKCGSLNGFCNKFQDVSNSFFRQTSAFCSLSRFDNDEAFGFSGDVINAALERPLWRALSNQHTS